MNKPIKAPAGFTPEVAVTFADANGDSQQVSSSMPLPVTVAATPVATPAPLTGTAATSSLVGPFSPALHGAVMLSLTGTWSGQARLLRSTDGGSTKLPLTALGQAYGLYTANVCEPVWEEGEAGATLWLDITLTSGALTYRMGQ